MTQPFNPLFRVLLGLALFAWLPLSVWAQNQKSSNLDDVQIIFEKNKEIILPLEDKPITNRQQTIKQDTITRDFQTLSKDLMFPGMVLDIKPRVLSYTSPEEVQRKWNYIKAGIGNYLTTHLEGFYTQGNKTDYVAAKFLHFNSALGSEKWQASGVNQLHVFGTYKAFKGRLKADLLLENNRNTLYGFIPTTAESRSDIRVSNTRTGFTALYSVSKSQKYDFDFGIQAFGVSSFANQKSYFASVSPVYTRYLGDNQTFSVQPTLSINTLYSAKNKSVGFFDTKVAYSKVLDKFTVKPWVKILYESDSIDSKKVHLYPGIEAQYAITSKLAVFAIAYGDYSQNLLYNQIKVNPWLNDISQFSYLNNPITALAGVRASTPTLGIEASAGIRQYKNYLVYAPGLTDSARMVAINLRDTTVTLSFLQASATYRWSDNLSLESGVLVQGASSSFKANIPNIPAFTWRIAPAFKIDNWAIVPALTLKSSYKLLTPTLGTASSGAIVDLSAKVLYSLSHRFNLNIDLYNLANNKAYLYYGYRQRGAMAVFGLTFKF